MALKEEVRKMYQDKIMAENEEEKKKIEALVAAKEDAIVSV